MKKTIDERWSWENSISINGDGEYESTIRV